MELYNESVETEQLYAFH